MITKTAAARLGTIFISYSSQDKPFVERLNERLVESGYTTWLDRKDLVPGEPLATTIVKGIDEASVQIVVMSGTSVQSDWVRYEVNHAVTRMNKRELLRVIPALIAGSALQPEVAALKYADFRTSFDHGMQELLGALEKLADEVLIGGIRSQVLFRHVDELTPGQVDWGTRVTFYSLTTLRHAADDGEPVVLHEDEGYGSPIEDHHLVDFENLAENAPEHRFLVLSGRPFAFDVPEYGVQLHARVVGFVTDSPWGTRRAAIAAIDTSGDASDGELSAALDAAAAWLASHPENESPQEGTFTSPPVPKDP